MSFICRHAILVELKNAQNAEAAVAASASKGKKKNGGTSRFSMGTLSRPKPKLFTNTDSLDLLALYGSPFHDTESDAVSDKPSVIWPSFFMILLNMRLPVDLSHSCHTFGRGHVPGRYGAACDSRVRVCTTRRRRYLPYRGQNREPAV